MNEQCGSIKIHFTYVTIILITTIIFIGTDRWTDKENFTEFLTNAATMVSLVLGLVAIFYSFISNDGLSKGLGNIKLVADEVGRSREQMTLFTVQAEKLAHAGIENNTQLSIASENVKRNLEELTQALDAITNRTADLHESVINIPNRFDKLEILLDDNSKVRKQELKEAVSTTPTSSVNNWNSTETQRFFERASLSMNLVTLACALANQKNKELNLHDLMVALEANLMSFTTGFIASMHACGVIQRHTVKNKEKTYKIVTISPLVASTIKTYFLNYIKETYAGDEDEQIRWQRRLAAVEQLFPD